MDPYFQQIILQIATVHKIRILFIWVVDLHKMLLPLSF